jgi:hypothetical protein
MGRAIPVVVADQMMEMKLKLGFRLLSAERLQHFWMFACIRHRPIVYAT